MPYETIEFELSDAIATITINRPDNANALNLKMAEELFDASVRCTHDGVRAVLMTGRGKMFCGGGDLAEMDEAGDDRAALGLAGVAVRAGARSAVGSLWSVSDEATSELIVDFYRELGEADVSKAEAMARAQRALLADTRLAFQVASAELAPCWALMLAFDGAVQTSFDALRVTDGPVSWVAREASKPGRAPGDRWVAHASPAASQRHLEETPERMAERMLAQVEGLLGPLPPVRRAVAHRWRYARVTRPLGRDALFDEAYGLGACGDWCRGPRVEEAYVSGIEMAALLDAELGHD